MRILIIFVSLLLMRGAAGPELIPNETNLDQLVNAQDSMAYRFIQNKNTKQEQRFSSFTIYFDKNDLFKYVNFDKLTDLQDSEWQNVIQTYIFDGKLEEIEEFQIKTPEGKPYTQKDGRLYRLVGSYHEWVDGRLEHGKDRWAGLSQIEFVLITKTANQVVAEWIEHDKGTEYIGFQKPTTFKKI